MSSNEISTLGVVGNDGFQPIYEPEATFKTWAKSEIWDGITGKGRYVPKVKDFVIDNDLNDTYTVYKVISIDAVTLIPKLVELKNSNLNTVVSTEDQLFGVGPGTQSDTYRVYLDTSVTPHVLAVDARLKVAGSMCSYAKIFLGADTSKDGTIISRIYDNSGNVLSDKIPLELVAIDSHVNYSIKNVAVCYTNLELSDGELVTAVFYSDDGHVVSKRQLIIVNTAFIRQIDDSVRYVTGISLDSPFISSSSSDRIEFPLNVPIAALNLMGQVHYSDGSSMRLPVDNTKFRIFGLDQYVSTIVGQEIDLVLSYTLSPGEAVYGAVVGLNKAVTNAYKLITVDPNNSYTVKVFGYPVWIDEPNGYVMRWWMLNLDRNVYYDVSSYVKFAQNTGAFNPKGYGYMQRKAIQLNLRDVSGAFKPYIHTQLVDITLNDVPNGRSTAWTVAHVSDEGKRVYGNNLFAVLDTGATSVGKLNISCGFDTIQNWLTNVYLNTYPLVDTYREVSPPMPDYFEIIYNGQTARFPIDRWDDALLTGISIPLNATIFIRFFKWTPSGEMNLSFSALRVVT